MKRLFTAIACCILCFHLLPAEIPAAELLIPGGQIIGLELENDTVTVAAFDDRLGSSARSSGLQIGDELLSINDRAVSTPQDIRAVLSGVHEPVRLTVRRDGRRCCISITPQQTPDGPRLGIYLKQGITGIGTVTWYDPGTGTFGTLGHGVSDGRGKLLTLHRGTAFHAEVASIRKGICGEPGQLKGSADAFVPCGSLLRNTPQGVFGITKETWPGTPVPVAEFSDVRTGDACIRSAALGRGIQEYSVEIIRIYPRDRCDNRNFLLKITDPALLSATGGIVQGMSGSPILQNGKLVGAVTHVLVNDPTRGYGIFIENMLEAAE